MDNVQRNSILKIVWLLYWTVEERLNKQCAVQTFHYNQDFYVY
jgi:hypothetical protein